MTVTERAPLSRGLIAETALALIDERGLKELSMRKLGAELGVEAMSLYNHVANKDDLLDAVTDVLYAEVLAAYGEPAGEWRERAVHLANCYVASATAHPRAFSLLVDRSQDSHNALRFVDRVVSLFDDVTDDLRIAALAFSVVANWVVGSLVQQIAADDDRAAVEDTHDFPRVASFRRELLENITREERFAEGLETVLDGIDARYFSR